MRDPGGSNECRTKKLVCARCGGYVEKPFRYYRRAYHEECGDAEMRDAIVQMHEKSGPYWDRWVSSNALGSLQYRTATPYPIDLCDPFDPAIPMWL